MQTQIQGGEKRRLQADDALTLISDLSLQASEGASESLTLAHLQGELVGVQSSLFALGLELEASQRSLRQSQRQGDDLMRFKDRLNSDLQEVLQHREATEKHNQVSLLCKCGSEKKAFRLVCNLSSLCAAGPPLRPSENSLGTSG